MEKMKYEEKYFKTIMYDLAMLEMEFKIHHCSGYFACNLDDIQKS